MVSIKRVYFSSWHIFFLSIIAPFSLSYASYTEEREELLHNLREKAKAFHSAEYKNQWGLAAIHADAAYAGDFTGKGQTIALIDLPAPSLVSLVPNLEGQIEFPPLPTSPVNQTKHTHMQDVASIIVGKKNIPPHLYHGLAFDSKVVAYTNSGPAAIYDGLKRGIKIFNNSWGVNFPRSFLPLLEFRERLEFLFYPQRQIVEQTNFPITAFKHAVRQGAVLVWSTGNGGALKPRQGGLPLLIPELKKGWLTVTAIAKNGEIAPEASPCQEFKEWCLAAPGGDPIAPLFVATGARYGTSYATAYVSGAIALLKSGFPTLTEQQIAERLLYTATKEGPYANKEIYGHGLLNLEQAVLPIGETYFIAGRNVNSGNLFSTIKSTLILWGEDFRTIFKPIDDIRILAFDEFQRAPFALPLQYFIHVKQKPYHSFSYLQQEFDQLFHTQSIQHGNLHYHFAPSDSISLKNKLHRLSITLAMPQGKQYGFYMNQHGGEIFGKGKNAPIGIYHAKNPYLSFSQKGMGSFYHVELDPKSYIKMGLSKSAFESENTDLSYPGKSFYSAQVEFGKQLGDWLFSSQYALIQNKRGLFHLNGTEGFGLGNKTTTEVIHGGIEWLISPHLSWKNNFYSAKSKVQSSGMIQTPTAILSQAFHSGLHYQDKKRTAGIYLYQPLTITKGNMILQAVTGVEKDGQLTHTPYAISLKSKRQYHLEAFYHHHLTRHSQFALHANYGRHSPDNAIYMTYIRNF